MINKSDSWQQLPCQKPITVISVLPGNNSDSLKYVETTYDQWKAGETPAYMATVNNRTQQIQTRSVESHLNLEIGDGSIWNGYTNGALDATGNYQ